jgi:hypothetical protein
MGQLPYFPPTVAGWQGGITWPHTDTALARFAFITTLLEQEKIRDVAGESAEQAYVRAYAAVGSPWLAAGTEREIRRYAARAQFSTSELRINRQVALRALILAGPDAQVM